MNWHYEKNGGAIGPLTDAQVESARAGGEIHASTRVWCEGWPEWRSAGEVWPASNAGLPGAASAQPLSLTRCAECGAPHADLVTLGNSLVCPACRPRALEKLREGVPIGRSLSGSGFGGPWRDGKILVVGKGAPLPELCFKCGGTPTKHLNRKLTWHHPAIYLTILVNLIVYVIVALIVRKTEKVRIPVCAACNGRRLRNNVIGTLVFLLSVVLLGYGVSSSGTGSDYSTAFLLSGTLLILFSLLLAFSFQFATARKINDRFVWINKAGKNLLDTLPQWPGE